MTIQSAEATRQEIVSYYGNRKVQFEHWTREIYDPRTETGVRHKTLTTAKCRVIDGVPTVRYLGDDYELKARRYTMETGRTFIATPTIM